MNDRFLFNAVVSSYYDIDTPENYEEFEPQIYLEYVDLFSDEIGIDYDRLLDAVQNQLNLKKPEMSQVMQHFEDNSNSISEEYVTIKPDKVLQCTGLKDKNGKLIYENDILLEVNGKHHVVEWNNDHATFFIEQIEKTGWFDTWHLARHNLDYEVIGNIYENAELLEVNNNERN